MSEKVLLEKDGRIGRIILNRPDVLNAIDDEVPSAIAARVGEANADPDIHVIVLSGAGRAFCAGYDLTYYASSTEGSGRDLTQDMPWDPMKDYAFMHRNTQLFMSLWHSHKPVIAKVHGYAAAGGSDIALCCDMVVMADGIDMNRHGPAETPAIPAAATGIARLGHGTDIIKRVLNHSVQGVTAIYNRYDYLDEKRAALEDWGERLREIANG